MNHKKEPIPGSNIRRKSKPGNQWVEILNSCCYPPEIDCTCNPRFFVQLDGIGKPVDGTLIKRKRHPEPIDNIRYMEVQAPDCCT